MRQSRERGSALALVILVTLVLAGLGLLALRQTRSELLGAGGTRASVQAAQAAQTGLARFVSFLERTPTRDVFAKAMEHRMDTGNGKAEYTFGEDLPLPEPGIMTVPSPFADTDTMAQANGDIDRVGKTEYTISITNPRLAPPPPAFQVNRGAGTLNLVFYIWEFEATGWVNRVPNADYVDVHGGGAMKKFKGDLRFAVQTN